MRKDEGRTPIYRHPVVLVWLAIVVAAVAFTGGGESESEGVEVAEPTVTTISDEIKHRMAFNAFWETKTEAERAEICEGYFTFGPEEMYRLYTSDMSVDAQPTLLQFREFFEWECY